jgi:hypothetical protein
MRYRGENLVENSVNEGCRGWDLEDIAGDSCAAGSTTCPRHLKDLHPNKYNKWTKYLIGPARAIKGKKRGKERKQIFIYQALPFEKYLAHDFQIWESDGSAGALEITTKYVNTTQDSTTELPLVSTLLVQVHGSSHHSRPPPPSSNHTSSLQSD